jgi:hypothetical protein
MQRRSQIHGFDYANSIAVSPNGDIVFATGSNDGAYATAGYDTTISALR